MKRYKKLEVSEVGREILLQTECLIEEALNSTYRVRGIDGALYEVQLVYCYRLEEVTDES